MFHSAEFKKKLCLRLRALQLSVKFNPKIFLSTPRCIIAREFATICKNDLTRYSVTEVGLNEKKFRVENHVRLSL
jgi:hypothetical protein